MIRETDVTHERLSPLIDNLNPSQKAEISQLLKKFPGLFEVVKGMPAKRAIEHGIQLLANASLPNLGLYCNSVMDNEDIKK